MLEQQNLISGHHELPSQTVPPFFVNQDWLKQNAKYTQYTESDSDLLDTFFGLKIPGLRTSLLQDHSSIYLVPFSFFVSFSPHSLSFSSLWHSLIIYYFLLIIQS